MTFNLSRGAVTVFETAPAAPPVANILYLIRKYKLYMYILSNSLHSDDLLYN